MEKLMTIDEVAELLRVKKTRIYSLTSGKGIPFLKKIGGLRFRKADIEKWLDDNVIQPQPVQLADKRIGRPRRNSLSAEKIDRMVEMTKEEVLCK